MALFTNEFTKFLKSDNWFSRVGLLGSSTPSAKATQLRTPQAGEEPTAGQALSAKETKS